ncbi:LOW QUALITY PROTEIN: S-adenosylhomocysteine deaminase [Geomicrobium sp. JCM 19039]|nr:LOW QUALITY PROTEIN: S-adenosylhomocysteine deaminase [Geomicrobium sp. JCM 19039]
MIKDTSIIDGETVIERGYVVIREGQFQEVGAGDYETNSNTRTHVISGKGKMMMPGLVNTHTHSPMTLLRGWSDDLELERWLSEKIWPAEAQMTEQMSEAGTNLALVEMIRSGTTMFSDMYHLNREGTARAVEETGMKALLTRGMITMFDSASVASEKLHKAVDYAKRCNASPTERLKGGLFPHAVYTNRFTFLEDVREAATKEQLPIQLHMSETKKEVADHLRTYGMRPAEHLLTGGILSEGDLLVHAVHVDEDEITLMNDKTTVSHNPLSNLKLGSGIAPIPHMHRRGVGISLGTDSAASNNTLDIFAEMRQAAMLHKGALQSAEVISSQEALRMATVNGARALGFLDSGFIQAGYAADFIMIDTRSAHLQPLTIDPATLVYAAGKNDVSDVYVNGRPLMTNKELLTIDEERVLYDANRARKQLVESSN